LVKVNVGPSRGQKLAPTRAEQQAQREVCAPIFVRLLSESVINAPKLIRREETLSLLFPEHLDPFGRVRAEEQAPIVRHVEHGSQ